MSGTRFVACLTARSKLAARRRPPFINTASGFLAHGASKRSTARAGVVSAAHAASAVVDLVRQACRHAAAVGIRFVDRKINPEAGAASAAGEAGVGHGVTGGEW